MRQHKREFTVAEFSKRCEQRTRGRIYPVPFDSIEPFLNRCVEVGLLTKRQDEQIARYTTTPMVAYMFEKED